MSLKRSLLSLNMSLWRCLRGEHVAEAEPAEPEHVAVAVSAGVNMSLKRSVLSLNMSL